MDKIFISNNMQMSSLVCGCMRLKDSNLSNVEIDRFVRECIDLGISSFDHAPIYGAYTCEKLFGDAVLVKDKGLRKKIELITKTGIVRVGRNGNKTFYYDSSRDEILKELEDSLLNLSTDYIDLLLVHRPDLYTSYEELGKTLDEVLDSGKVLNVGVSNFNDIQFRTLQKFMKNKLVTNQVELSVLALENMFNGVVDSAFYNDIPLMIWSPLAKGQIFNSNDENIIRLRVKLEEIAREHNTNIDVIMYSFLYSHPIKKAVITGTFRIDRIKKAIEGRRIKLSRDEWYGILEASRGLRMP